MLPVLFALLLQDPAWRRENGPIPPELETSRNGRLVLHGILGSRRWKQRTDFGRIEFLDNARLLCASDTGLVRIWDGAGRVAAIWESPSGARAAAVSPDGKFVLVAGGGSLHLFECSTSRKLSVWDHGSFDATCLAWNSDGTRFASGGIDHRVRVWDPDHKKPIFLLEGHKDEVTSIAISMDDRTLFSVGLDRTLRLWNLADGEPFDLQNAPEVDQLAVDDDHLLMTGPLGLSASNYRTGKSEATVPESSKIRRFSLSQDRRWAVTGESGKIRVWDWAKKVERSSWPFMIGESIPNHLDALAISPDGKRVAAGSWHSGLVVWDAETGSRLGGRIGHTAGIVGTTRLDSKLYSVDVCGSLLRWDLENLLEERRWWFWDQVNCLMIRDRSLRGIRHSYEKKSSLFDLESEKTITELSGVSVASVVTPDARRILTPSGDRLVVVSATSFEVEATWKAPGMASTVAISADGQWVASAGEKGTRVWKLSDGKEILTRSSKTPISSIALDGTGKHLVEVTRDDTVSVAETETGRETRWKVPHCVKAAFCGAIVVTVGPGSMNLWSVAGEEIDSIPLDSYPEGLDVHDRTIVVRTFATLWLYRVK